MKAVKAEEDFHDATDDEKDLDNGKGRSKVAKAKGKGSKGKDKGSSEKVETKETKGKGGKSGKSGKSGKGGKGGKAKSRETEKDLTEEKQETSKDDSNAAKDRGSMAETSMDHFGAKLSAGCDLSCEVCEVTG